MNHDKNDPKIRDLAVKWIIKPINEIILKKIPDKIKFKITKNLVQIIDIYNPHTTTKLPSGNEILSKEQYPGYDAPNSIDGECNEWYKI